MPGQTLGLVILSSDKTHLTVGQGDKECHAVYMSCGNIRKVLRTKVGAHAWLMIAQIPVAKFEPKKYQTLLTNRLIHQCLDITLAGLKECAVTAENMTDANGHMRSVRTFLYAYIADLPEQQALACVRTNYAPSSYAEPDTLGNSTAHELRHGSETIDAIERIKCEAAEAAASDELGTWKKLSADYGLNGIDKPFWRDWLCSDPCLFLAPDALHQWHKFFNDHCLEWAKKWLGEEEFDRQLSVLQPLVGRRHFAEGFTRFKQHTGKETKDLERVFLPVIAGHESITEGIMVAMRALLDFIYLARYGSHSTSTLRYLDKALRDFHRNKRHVAASGVRSGVKQNNEFHIPKVELMQHVRRLIVLLGSAPQFSSEQTERCHIDMAKHPYKATNRKDYVKQMCQFLDREEKTRLFSPLTEWQSIIKSSEPQGSAVSQAAREEAFQRLIGCYLPTPVRNIFRTTVSTLCTETTAIQLGRKPDMRELPCLGMQSLYELPNLIDDLRRYFLRGFEMRHTTYLPFNTVNTWSKMRLQLKDPQDTDIVLSPYTIQALPPKRAGEIVYSGRYNFVLIRRSTVVDRILAESGGNFGIQGNSMHLCLHPLLIHSLS